MIVLHLPPQSVKYLNRRDAIRAKSVVPALRFYKEKNPISVLLMRGNEK